MDNMRLLIVSSGDFFSDYGGGQVYVKDLVDELIRQGITPFIASPGDPERSPRMYNKCSVHMFSVSSSKSYNFEILSLLRSISPDIVHVHGTKSVFAKACAILGIPSVITAHHGGILCPGGTLLNYRDRICTIEANHGDCLPCVLRNIRFGIFSFYIIGILPLKIRLGIGRLLRRTAFIPYLTPIGTASLSIQERADDWKTICRYATALVAPSRAIAESMVRNGAPEHKVRILPHGVVLPDNADLEANNKAEKSFNNCVRFFYVGRICYVKGLHVLLKAFAGIQGCAELHIIGGAGSRKEVRYMKRLRKKYSKDQRIVWHGKIEKEKLNRLIVGFDVMVHPTICLEVFGLNVSEALALGKPVVATRCGGVEQQMQEGINGFLVEPNEVQPLMETMQMFADHQIDVDRMSNAGMASVKSLSKHVSELIGLYHELASRAEDDKMEK